MFPKQALPYIEYSKYSVAKIETISVNNQEQIYGCAEPHSYGQYMLVMKADLDPS